MKNKFKEYKKLLIYSLLAILIGVIVGAIDTLFGRILLLIGDFRDDRVLYLLPFLPFSGIIIMLLYKYFSKESIKGMTLVFKTGHGENKIIPRMLIPLVMISTWITHLFGGSAGREGVAVQLGATVSHNFANRFKLDSKAFLVIGMAAGFSGLFQTPLAATFFALEVLVSGVLIYDVLLPTIIGAYSASLTSHFLGLEKFSFNIEKTISLNRETIIKLIVLGIIFGLVGAFFAHSLDFLKAKLNSFISDPIKRIFFIGIILALLLIFLHLGRYSGLGTNLIDLSFSEGNIYSYDWILKILLTILTLSAGFQGGEVTPLFSIGASLGVVLGGLLGLPIFLCAALGYIAVFGSATNTLIAPIFIGAEVFGAENTIYFVIICAISFIISGNKSIYTSQKNFKLF